MRVKTPSDHTDNAFALLETLVLPGPGAAPHMHLDDDEGFYVIDGLVPLHLW